MILQKTDIFGIYSVKFFFLLSWQDSKIEHNHYY